MLPLKSIGLCFFGRNIRFNLVLIGVVIGQGSMDLRQRQMTDPAGNAFYGGMLLLVCTEYVN